MASVCVFHSSNQACDDDDHDDDEHDDHHNDDHDDDHDEVDYDDDHNDDHYDVVKDDVNHDDDHADDHDDDAEDSQAGCDEPTRAVGPQTSTEASSRNRNLPGIFTIQLITYLAHFFISIFIRLTNRHLIRSLHLSPFSDSSRAVRPVLR